MSILYPQRNSKKIPPLLHSKIKNRKCVAFVGAGFSTPCGMPGWKGLLQGLLGLARKTGIDDNKISICKAAIDGGQYPLAANLLRNNLGKAEINSYIRNKFSLDLLKKCNKKTTTRIRNRQKNLVDTVWAGIITTNYDSLIEDAFSRSSQSEPITVGGNDSNLASILCDIERNKKFFVKLHGSAPTSYKILTTDEYENAYINKENIKNFLTAVMLSYHVVYIGCSLEDEIQRFRRKLCLDFEGMLPMSYALLPKTMLNEARAVVLKDDYQIEIIFYDPNSPNNFGTHSAVDFFLKYAK